MKKTEKKLNNFCCCCCGVFEYLWCVQWRYLRVCASVWAWPVVCISIVHSVNREIDPDKRFRDEAWTNTYGKFQGKQDLKLFFLILISWSPIWIFIYNFGIFQSDAFGMIIVETRTVPRNPPSSIFSGLNFVWKYRISVIAISDIKSWILHTLNSYLYFT